MSRFMYSADDSLTLAKGTKQSETRRMPGVNPALLASLKGASATSPEPAAPATAGGPAGSEPAPDIHTAYLELNETLKIVVEMAADLKSSCEIEDDVDPKAEKIVSQVAEMLTKAASMLADAGEMMGVSGDDSDADGSDGSAK